MFTHAHNSHIHSHVLTHTHSHMLTHTCTHMHARTYTSSPLLLKISQPSPPPPPQPAPQRGLLFYSTLSHHRLPRSVSGGQQSTRRESLTSPRLLLLLLETSVLTDDTEAPPSPQRQCGPQLPICPIQTTSCSGPSLSFPNSASQCFQPPLLPPRQLYLYSRTGAKACGDTNLKTCVACCQGAGCPNVAK